MFPVLGAYIKLAIPLGSVDLSEPYFSLLIVRKRSKYQKVDTYEHSLQILGLGSSPFEENLPRVDWTPEKKCKRSMAKFVLTGTLRASTCWELVLRGSSSGGGFGGPESDISSSFSIP